MSRYKTLLQKITDQRIIVTMAMFGVIIGLAILVPVNETRESKSIAPTKIQSETSTTSSEIADLTSTPEVKLDITDSGFSMANIKIMKGTRVTWSNTDTNEHSIALESTDQKISSPEGEKLAKGQADSFSFDEPAVYTFHCGIHTNIQGTIIVVD